MICPGNNGDCNGVTNGVCVAMNVLATVKTDNGDATAFTYGDVPNDPPVESKHKLSIIRPVRYFLSLVVCLCI